MSDTQNTSSSWKKTASIVSLAVGGLLIAVGNFFGGSLDLSAGLVQVFNALAAILGAFGIGTLASGKASASTDADEGDDAR